MLSRLRELFLNKALTPSLYQKMRRSGKKLLDIAARIDHVRELHPGIAAAFWAADYGQANLFREPARFDRDMAEVEEKAQTYTKARKVLGFSDEEIAEDIYTRLTGGLFSKQTVQVFNELAGLAKKTGVTCQIDRIKPLIIAWDQDRASRKKFMDVPSEIVKLHLKGEAPENSQKQLALLAEKYAGRKREALLYHIERGNYFHVNDLLVRSEAEISALYEEFEILSIYTALAERFWSAMSTLGLQGKEIFEITHYRLKACILTEKHVSNYEKIAEFARAVGFTSPENLAALRDIYFLCAEEKQPHVLMVKKIAEYAGAQTEVREAISRSYSGRQKELLMFHSDKASLSSIFFISEAEIEGLYQSFERLTIRHGDRDIYPFWQDSAAIYDLLARINPEKARIIIENKLERYPQASPSIFAASPYLVYDEKKRNQPDELKEILKAHLWAAGLAAQREAAQSDPSYYETSEILACANRLICAFDLSKLQNAALLRDASGLINYMQEAECKIKQFDFESAKALYIRAYQLCKPPGKYQSELRSTFLPFAAIIIPRYIRSYLEGLSFAQKEYQEKIRALETPVNHRNERMANLMAKQDLLKKSRVGDIKLAILHDLRDILITPARTLLLLDRILEREHSFCHSTATCEAMKNSLSALGRQNPKLSQEEREKLLAMDEINVTFCLAVMDKAGFSFNLGKFRKPFAHILEETAKKEAYLETEDEILRLSQISDNDLIREKIERELILPALQEIRQNHPEKALGLLHQAQKACLEAGLGAETAEWHLSLLDPMARHWTLKPKKIFDPESVHPAKRWLLPQPLPIPAIPASEPAAYHLSRFALGHFLALPSPEFSLQFAQKHLKLFLQQLGLPHMDGTSAQLSAFRAASARLMPVETVRTAIQRDSLSLLTSLERLKGYILTSNHNEIVLAIIGIEKKLKELNSPLQESFQVFVFNLLAAPNQDERFQAFSGLCRQLLEFKPA